MEHWEVERPHVGPFVALAPVVVKIAVELPHDPATAQLCQFALVVPAAGLTALPTTAANVLGVEALIAVPYRLITMLALGQGWPGEGATLQSVSP